MDHEILSVMFIYIYADRMRKGVKKCAQTHDTGEDLL